MKKLSLIILVLLAVAGIVSGVSANQITIDSEAVDPDDTVIITFTLDEAPNGLLACIYTVSLDTPGIVNITAINFPVWAELKQSDFISPAQSVRIKFGDLSFPVDNGPGASHVPLGSITVVGLRPGTSAVILMIEEPNGLADADDVQFRPTITTGQVIVNGLTNSLEVISSPAGASIRLDGSDTGEVTPFTFTAIPAGDHLVLVQKDGYYGAAKVATVVADSPVTADFRLTRRRARLQ
ncbi:MAG: hypothetical protein APR53_04235 [Methanoculleus sp. SDB]|nr:MAG: hypothetical protein APR53_04235 [Methanoculleus sp. SDB]